MRSEIRALWLAVMALSSLLVGCMAGVVMWVGGDDPAAALTKAAAAAGGTLILLTSTYRFVMPDTTI